MRALAFDDRLQRGRSSAAYATQHRGGVPDRRQRVAQLVRQRRQELGLALLRQLRGGLQFLREQGGQQQLLVGLLHLPHSRSSCSSSASS